jgi:hypothetical protein
MLCVRGKTNGNDVTLELDDLAQIAVDRLAATLFAAVLSTAFA